MWIRSGTDGVALLVGSSDRTAPQKNVSEAVGIASVRSSGGGIYVPLSVRDGSGDAYVVYVAGDGRVMASAPISGAVGDGALGQPRALTSIEDGNAAALVASSGLLACVLETDDRCGVVEIDLTGGVIACRRLRCRLRLGSGSFARWRAVGLARVEFPEHGLGRVSHHASETLHGCQSLHCRR